MKTFLFCVALLASGTALATTPVPAVPESAADPVVAASPPVAAATPVTAPAVSDEDKMICERVKELGSTRLKRVCKSMAQLERERAAARDAVDRTRSR